MEEVCGPTEGIINIELRPDEVNNLFSSQTKASLEINGEDFEFFLIEVTTATTVFIYNEPHNAAFLVPAAIVSDGALIQEQKLGYVFIGLPLIEEQYGAKAVSVFALIFFTKFRK